MFKWSLLFLLGVCQMDQAEVSDEVLRAFVEGKKSGWINQATVSLIRSATKINEPTDASFSLWKLSFYVGIDGGYDDETDTLSDEAKQKIHKFAAQFSLNTVYSKVSQGKYDVLVWGSVQNVYDLVSKINNGGLPRSIRVVGLQILRPSRVGKDEVAVYFIDEEFAQKNSAIIEKYLQTISRYPRLLEYDEAISGFIYVSLSDTEKMKNIVNHPEEVEAYLSELSHDSEDDELPEWKSVAVAIGGILGLEENLNGMLVTKDNVTVSISTGDFNRSVFKIQLKNLVEESVELVIGKTTSTKMVEGGSLSRLGVTQIQKDGTRIICLIEIQGGMHSPNRKATVSLESVPAKMKAGQKRIQISASFSISELHESLGVKN